MTESDDLNHRNTRMVISIYHHNIPFKAVWGQFIVDRVKFSVISQCGILENVLTRSPLQQLKLSRSESQDMNALHVRTDVEVRQKRRVHVNDQHSLVRLQADRMTPSPLVTPHLRHRRSGIVLSRIVHRNLSRMVIGSGSRCVTLSCCSCCRDTS